MKKILYLHGFLGLEEDMTPLFLEDCISETYDLRKLLFVEDPIVKLRNETSLFYDAIVGYSFGGRLAEELQALCPDRAGKWVFCSSRHTKYPDAELLERSKFQMSLKSKVMESLDEFYSYWDTLALFSGHKMSDYREKYDLTDKVHMWTDKEVLNYLDRFFTFEQRPLVKNENVFYLYGEKDQKYSKEAERLESYFNVESFKNCGHRAIFEDVSEFKNKLNQILENK